MRYYKLTTILKNLNTMNDNEKNIKKLVAVTIITAIISGVIGALINDYTSRAKPSVSLTSIGFRSPIKKESIELPNDLITLTSKSDWSPILKKFERFEKLVKVENE